MPAIDQILSCEELEQLRADYDQTQVDQILTQSLPAIYAPSKPLIDGIDAIYKSNLANDDGQPRAVISEADRERILIALLSSQNQTSNLAIHIYLAIAKRDLKIEPEEVASVILITGVYAGIATFTNGIGVLAQTLGLFKKRIADGCTVTPVQAIKAIQSHFSA